MEDTIPNTDKELKEEVEEGQKVRTEFAPEHNDTIKIGDVILSSRYFLVNDLVAILKDMLKDKNIKEYIDLIKRKEKTGRGYLG